MRAARLLSTASAGTQPRAVRVWGAAAGLALGGLPVGHLAQCEQNYGFATLACSATSACTSAYTQRINEKLAKIHEVEAQLLQRMDGTRFEVSDIPVELNVGRRCFMVELEREYTIHTVAVGLEHRNKKVPLVLVHGFMMGSAAFFKWLPLLAAERTVYSIDIIGMAGSGRPPFDASRLSADEAEALLVDAFERWADAMGLQRFALLGHSFGGYVCGAWAVRHPERIVRLGLLSPLLGFSDDRISKYEDNPDAPWQLRAFRCIVDTAWAQKITPQAIVRWVPGAKSWFERASQRRFQSFAQDVSEEEGRLLSEYVVATMDMPSSTEPAPLVCFGPLLKPLEVRGGTIKQRLSRLQMPVFVVYGDHDWMDRASPAELPNCEFVGIPRSGHHLYLDNPRELAKQVLARSP